MIFLILFQCVQRDLERKEIEEESKEGKSAPHASHVAKLSNSRPFPVLAVSYPSAILFEWFQVVSPFSPGVGREKWSEAARSKRGVVVFARVFRSIWGFFFFRERLTRNYREAWKISMKDVRNFYRDLHARLWYADLFLIEIENKEKRKKKEIFEFYTKICKVLYFIELSR